MAGADDHGARIRQGLRRAARRGRSQGGWRLATDEKNQQAHRAALRQALYFRKTLLAGRGKTLAELSKDLFAAGCRTRSDGPFTPEMVRRLRERLEEAALALADGVIEDESCDWDARSLVDQMMSWRDGYLFRWSLRMARKEYGDGFAHRLIEHLLCSQDACWAKSNLA